MCGRPEKVRAHFFFPLRVIIWEWDWNLFDRKTTTLARPQECYYYYYYVVFLLLLSVFHFLRIRHHRLFFAEVSDPFARPFLLFRECTV